MRVYVYSSGYNCAEYARKCILSVKNQTFQNFTHVIVDDCSTDNTYEVCKRERSLKSTLVKAPENKKWIGAAVEYCKPSDSDIVICLDLDDWLSNNQVLKKIVDLHESGFWLTYGQYVNASNMKVGTHCKLYSPQVLQDRDFRNHNFVASHLRTYRGFLWNNINKEHLKDWDGKYAEMTYDVGIMMPMMEMCKPGKIKFVEEPTYIYNNLNPLNDHKRSATLQKKTELWFRSLPKYPVLNRDD